MKENRFSPTYTHAFKCPNWSILQRYIPYIRSHIISLVYKIEFSLSYKKKIIFKITLLYVQNAWSFFLQPHKITGRYIHVCSNLSRFAGFLLLRSNPRNDRSLVRSKSLIRMRIPNWFTWSDGGDISGCIDVLFLLNKITVN